MVDLHLNGEKSDCLSFRKTAKFNGHQLIDHTIDAEFFTQKKASRNCNVSLEV